MYIVDGISVANPNGLAVDGSGNFYLIDYDNRKIAKGRISIDGVSQ
jgi:sugar lactone lactonase YvrE